MSQSDESKCLEMWNGLLQTLASGQEFATPGDGLLLCYEKTHKMLLERGEKVKEELELANQRKMPYGWTTESCKNWMDHNKELKEENDELKEEAEQNKQLFDTTFGEFMKLKEQTEELKDQLHQKGIDEQTAIEECEEAEEKVEELTEQVEDLSKVVEEQRKFDNWENHPALKHKVVLDEDFYLQHTDDSGYLLKHDDWVDYIQKVDCMTKFIAGDGGMQDQVEEHLKQTYSTEFIKGNTETWQEIGLFEDEI